MPLAFPTSEVIVGGPDELAILSAVRVDETSLNRCLWSSGTSSPRAYQHGTCVYFDAAARDAILALLADGPRTVRGTLAMQLAVYWPEIHDRDGRIYDALIAGIADDVLQEGSLRTIQAQVRSSLVRRHHLKAERPADDSLCAAVRAILADADNPNAFEAVGALIAIHDIEPVLDYWNSPDADKCDPHLSVRKAIATALADFGGPGELDVLRSFVADSRLHPALRRDALNALDERGEAGDAAQYDQEIEDALARR